MSKNVVSRDYKTHLHCAVLVCSFMAIDKGNFQPIRLYKVEEPVGVWVGTNVDSFIA
jgi:hypothetical protein